MTEFRISKLLISSTNIFTEGLLAPNFFCVSLTYPGSFRQEKYLLALPRTKPRVHGYGGHNLVTVQ